MKTKQLIYRVGNCTNCVPFQPDEPFAAVVSNQDSERSFFIAAIEMAFYKSTDSPYGHMVTQASVSMDDGRVHRYPLDIFDKGGNLPGDRQQFLDHVLGQAPFDIIKYLKGGQYEKEFNAVLKCLSGGKLVTIRWDAAMGMVVEHQNGVTRSIFSMSPGNIEILKFSARVVDLRMLRYPFQIVTGESLALLDRDRLVRFATELLDLPRQEIQVIFVCGLMDVLGSPLADLAGLRIINLDDRQEIPPESEV